MSDTRTFSQPSRKQLGVALAVLAFAAPFFLELDGLSEPGHRVLSIFAASVILWVTEAIPLHATAVFVIGSEILLISDQAIVEVEGFDGFEPPAYASFYSALAHPVLMLFLGGFFLAIGASKFALDRNLARILLRPFGTSSTAILGGLMGITALLSMFMSNTATTAAMFSLVIPVIAALDDLDPLRKGVALAIPLAANVGGIGTPVGTPPNAIVLGYLADAGIIISFLDWMLLAIPLVLILLVVSWFVLIRLYRPASGRLHLSFDSRFDESRQARLFYAVFAATIGLWMLEPVHGVPSTIVGFFPVVVLLATGVFGVDDLKSVQWHVLWLVGGGIALGAGVAATGFDTWLVGLIDWGSLAPTLLIVAIAVFALGMSTVISNSATANLLIPIGVSLALSAGVDIEPALAGVVIAIACSLAMALPVSTPPNAVAYATGFIETKDLAVVGLAVGLVGVTLLVLVAPPVWQALDLLP